jgi:hypothetical protein
MPWKTFLKAHWGAIAAADFFSVEVLTPVIPSIRPTSGPCSKARALNCYASVEEPEPRSVDQVRVPAAHRPAQRASSARRRARVRGALPRRAQPPGPGQRHPVPFARLAPGRRNRLPAREAWGVLHFYERTAA